jgi:hypothetical protein
MGRATRSYQPRHAEASVLHGVIREHLEDFLRAAADRADGAGLPEFIAREFREFLTCGWSTPPALLVPSGIKSERGSLGARRGVIPELLLDQTAQRSPASAHRDPERVFQLPDSWCGRIATWSTPTGHRRP